MDDRELVLRGVVHEIVVAPADGSWEYMIHLSPTPDALLTTEDVDALVEFLRPSGGKVVTQGQVDKAVDACRIPYLSDAEPIEYVRRTIKALGLEIA